MLSKTWFRATRALACLLLSAGWIDAAQAPKQNGIRVWAIGDSVRIDPVKGTAYEDNPLLFPDGMKSGYKDSNLIWDANQKRISLKAARNEIIAFQLIVERTGDAKLTNARVSIGELTGPAGKKIPAANIDLFKEWYVYVEKQSRRNYTLGTGWYPDALLPCTRWKGNLYPHTYVMPFEVPDMMNGVGEKQTNQALWADIYVPRDKQDAPAGRYTGTVAVISDAGRQDLQLQLDVWDFALPDQTHIAGNIHTDTEINAFPEEMELQYYQLMRKHRLAMGVLGYAPGLKLAGTDVQFDWAKYDQRLGKYLDGSAFTQKYGYHGPGYGVPVELLVAPFDAYPINLYKQAHGVIKNGKEFKFYAPWPVALGPDGRTPEYEQIWKNAFKKFEDHFNRPGWDKTRLIVYFLSLDEAYDDISRERMFYYGKLLKDSGAKRLEYRVDGWYPRETMLKLADVVKIAILGLGGWEPETVSELQKKGMDTWFYDAAGLTDGDPLQCRALGWISWKYHAGSWTLWELDFNSLRAWQYPETYPGLNGHGMLVYRGETMGLDEPAASMRLKMMRRGSQDYEYFWLLGQKGRKQAADDAVDSLITDFASSRTDFSLGSPGMWKHDQDDWERVRIKLGDLIEKSR